MIIIVDRINFLDRSYISKFVGYFMLMQAKIVVWGKILYIWEKESIHDKQEQLFKVDSAYIMMLSPPSFLENAIFIRTI